MDEVAFLPRAGMAGCAVPVGKWVNTLVPTYRDTLQFNLYYYPLWRRDLNGDGLAEYGAAGQRYRRRVTVYGGSPAPAFQMALEATEVSGGGLRLGHVWPNVISSSDRSVSLVAHSSRCDSVLASDHTGSGRERGQVLLQSRFELRPAGAGFDVTATLEQDQKLNFVRRVSFRAGLHRVADPNGQTRTGYPGDSSPAITVSIRAQSGYSVAVQLGCQQLLPGWSCVFTPPELALAPGAIATASLSWRAARTRPG